MARLWAWEAFAHGAEAVCYFRWRQAPFAQEQNHAGLLRPDSGAAPALAEAAQVAQEIADLPEASAGDAPVALVFDYESAWAWDTQPQGADFEMFRLAFAAYRALRRAGLSVDILPPDCDDLSAYKMVLAPGLMRLSDPLRAALARYDGIALIGPRTDTKDDELSMVLPLGPNLPNTDVSVVLTESIPPSDSVPLTGGGAFLHWFEHLEGDAPVRLATKDGRPAIMGGANLRYLAGWPSDDTFDILVRDLAHEAGVETVPMLEGLRIRDTATHRFVFNYAATAQDWNGTTIPAAGVHWEALS